MGILVTVIILALLFGVIHNVLRHIPIFQEKASMLALCVSLLCITGMMQGLVTDHIRAESAEFDFVLLLYAALGITILLMLLLKVSSRKSLKEKSADKYYKREDVHKSKAPVKKHQIKLWSEK